MKKKKKKAVKKRITYRYVVCLFIFFVFSLGQIGQILFNFREEAYQREVRGPRKFLVSVEEVDISGYTERITKNTGKRKLKVKYKYVLDIEICVSKDCKIHFSLDVRNCAHLRY